MSTITESKKDTLIDLLRQLENDIASLFHKLEEDQSIPDDKFREYEKQIEKLYYIHNQLNEEVILS